MPTIAVSIVPLKMILEPLVGDRATVHVIVPPGSSPHTFSLKPSDAVMASAARVFFYVSAEVEPWAAQIDARKRVALLDWIPEADRILATQGHDHAHGESADPHFWLDPVIVRELLPKLVEALSQSDPEGAAIYQSSAAIFATQLDALHREVRDLLAPVKHRPVIAYHPSVVYLLKRYDLPLAHAIEYAPGQEATGQHLQAIIETIKRERISAIFTEPQLNRKAADLIAEAAGCAVFELDPLGGFGERTSYEDLLRYNARQLQKALQ